LSFGEKNDPKSIMRCLEALCDERAFRLTEKQRQVCRVLDQLLIEHPDADRVVAEVTLRESTISRGTVYRTLKLLENAGFLLRHKFATGASRYEDARCVHYHLIDTCDGRIIEFSSTDIEMICRQIGNNLGYRLSEIKLELYGHPMKELPDTN
jgi:Fe2+ or Zn2+ uptake regulation protein